MYDVCGQREDTKYLNCPYNLPAVTPSEQLSVKIQSLCPTITGNICCTEQQFDILHDQVKQAVPFLVGCPACLRNFLTFFCTLACSPSQSLFVNITSTAPAATTNETTVDGIDLFVADKVGQQMYDACADVTFAALNTRAMDFIGGGAYNYHDWFTFMGRKAGPYEIGSPYAISFPPPPSGNSSVEPMSFPVVSCSDSALSCSCGDCPSANGCEPPASPPTNASGSCKIHLGGKAVGCLDLGLWMALLAVLVTLGLGFAKGHAARMDEEVSLTEPLSAEGEADSEAEGQAKRNSGDRRELPYIQRRLRDWFRWQGTWVALHPGLVLAVSAALVVLLALGLIRFQVETRPAKLWVGQGSQAAKEKDVYDAHLGPFYRIEQLLIGTKPPASGQLVPSIVTDENLQLLFTLQSKVDALTAEVDGRQVSLTDICFNPMGSACATQSILQYWKMDPDKFDELGGTEHAEFCFQHFSSSEPCLSAFLSPMDPILVLGGFDASNYSQATAFVITYPVNNYVNESRPELAAALAWEAAFLQLAQGELRDLVEAQNLTLAYSAESSIEAELKRESSADVATILVSYLVMFLYISLTLGDFEPSIAPPYVTSKVALALAGVVIVGASVAGSMGLCSALGVKSTLIIVEVIPFLVLAVGVDNMCILVHALKRQPSNLPLAEQIGQALGEVGPSISLASAAEAIAFLIAAATPMPACQVFSLFAAVAVCLDYLLQVTAFVALMGLDAQRTAAHRMDCLPWLTVQGSPDGAEGVEDGGPEAAELKPSILVRYMKEVHAPFLAMRWVKAAVLALFAALLLLSIGLASRVTAGLDQSVALPRDSYLQGYFGNLTEYLRVGPPVYFVVQDFNYSSESGQTNRLCSIGGCDPDSLLNEVSRAARTPDSTYIARPAASWLDDLLTWISPLAFSCCRRFPDGSYCPPDDQPPCVSDDPYSVDPAPSTCANCVTCFLEADLKGGRPSTAQFREMVPWFLAAEPSADCSKGGHGAYSHSLDLSDIDKGMIRLSEFRTYHTPVNKQSDYINSMRAARSFVDRVAASTGIKFFAYSVFYIFFEQYLTIVRTTLVTLFSAAVAVLAVCWLFTGSLWAAGIILAVLAMIVVDLLGLMALWGIQLNAVSLVNLVMTLGISVEFCVHIVQAFLVKEGTRLERSAHAVSTVGASVLSGITLTKLFGVIVLAFARSEIFKVYYFRMYFGLLVLGALHGLVFLPVLLGLVGPPPLGTIQTKVGIKGTTLYDSSG